MKTWLVSAAKFLAEYFVLLALLSAGGAFAADMAEPSLPGLGLAAASEALRLWPLALALVVGLGIVSWRNPGGGRLLPALSVCLLGSLISLAGFEARELARLETPGPRNAAVTGRAVEAGDLLASVRSIEGKRAGGAVTVDFSTTWPRLAWAASAPYDPQRGGLGPSMLSSSLLLEPRQARVPPLPFLANLPIPLGREEGDLLSLLFAALAFILLCAGLALPSLVLRWPLAALALTLFTVAAALGIDAWLSEPRISAGLVEELNSLGLVLEPVWIVTLIEGLIGLALGSLGLALAKRKTR